MFVCSKSILCFMYSHFPIYKLQDRKFGLITLFHKPDVNNWKQCWKNSFDVLSIYLRWYEGFVFLRPAVLCNVLLCSWVDEHRCFRGACCLHLLWRQNESWCLSATASHPRRQLNLFHLVVLDHGSVNPLVKCSSHSERPFLLLTTEASSVGLENALYIFEFIAYLLMFSNW